MSRFTSPKEVIDYAFRAAKNDIENHTRHGVGLNPFCTDGARTQWQRGFDNENPRLFESTLEFDTIYQRGKAAYTLTRNKLLTLN